MNTSRKMLATMLAVTGLAACSNGLSGTYGDAGKNGMQFVFDGDGKLQIKMGGLASGLISTGTYKVEGKQVSVFDPQGRGMTLKIDDHGCLTGAMIEGAACKQ